ncbi:hypothetical protein K443DRAFT_546848 [Laccaria amethystina LaAM-08-1]|uniref:Uncharacterized protein n=1 Tax=Laccaria amethystina LaAM-08-1 TaxID=1095629 RepID=A0A0C9XAG6_9AGAR|nr:hypothetical protein K443DRAFT_546848 [Laccaria amethystina LaAM-08-1]
MQPFYSFPPSEAMISHQELVDAWARATIFEMYLYPDLSRDQILNCNYNFSMVASNISCHLRSAPVYMGRTLVLLKTTNLTILSSLRTCYGKLLSFMDESLCRDWNVKNCSQNVKRK